MELATLRNVKKLLESGADPSRVLLPHDKFIDYLVTEARGDIDLGSRERVLAITNKMLRAKYEVYQSWLMNFSQYMVSCSACVLWVY